MPVPAAFPSVLSCTGRNLTDANGYRMPVMKGFNLQNVPWALADFQAMFSKGARLIRIAVFWDQLEPTSGNIDTVTYIPALDLTVQRAAAAGLYCWFNFYFGPNGTHEPSWAGTASAMSDYTTHGQNATQYLAKRYGDAADPLGAGQFTKAVIGMGINEPSPDAIDTAPWQTTTWTEQIQMVTWMRVYAANWIASMAPAWASSALIPNAAGSGQSGQLFTGISTSSPGVTNFWVDFHDYHWGTTAYTTPDYDGRTTYGRPVTVAQGGTEIGAGGTFNYPPVTSGHTLTASEMARMHAAWTAPFTDYCASANVPLMIGEWGFTPAQNTGWRASVADKLAQWAGMGVAGILQWDYNVNQSQDPWAVRPGSSATGADASGWQVAASLALAGPGTLMAGSPL